MRKKIATVKTIHEIDN